MHPTLLVDVMDTLVHDPFTTEIPRFFGLSMTELLRVKHPTAWQEFETGRIGETEFLARFFTDGRPFDHARFLAVVRDGYRWIDGAEELLSKLASAGIEVHALSNYPVWYRRIEEDLGLSRYLAWTFVSCVTGLRKPDERAFVNACARLGRAPGSCLFIDDRETNCRAAEEVGLPAVRFTSTRELEIELVRRGILAAPSS